MVLSRRKARITVLEILYQYDIANGDINEIIGTHLAEKNLITADKSLHKDDIKKFILKLSQGVQSHKKEIDKKIKSTVENWSIDRITIIDRNILRLAIFELFYCADVPYKVIIDEAIELGKLYGTEDSGLFINGILDKVVKGISSREEELREKDVKTSINNI